MLATKSLRKLIMGFDCVARTHVGLRRTLNEDAVLNSAEHGLWAVADGMGGHDAGEVASAVVIEALSGLQANGTIESRAAAAVSALEDANARLQDFARTFCEDRTIGSTVVGLVADERTYHCFWAGDSRAYRARDGVIAQLTRDHSLVQELVDAGMLAAEEADKHPNANVITRAVGADHRLYVDTVAGDLNAGDVFLLASDGLTRLVTAEDLLAKLSSADLQAAADELVEMALARGGPDNISLIIVRAA
jgi:serine/threonine protein phosphatase Stp1